MNQKKANASAVAKKATPHQEDDAYYTAGGKVAPNTDDEVVFAKKLWNGKYMVYWIKYATTGPDTGHLLNPWGMNFVLGVDTRRGAPHLGKKRYEFKQVSKEVFDMYIAFLETRSERYYRGAERALD